MDPRSLVVRVVSIVCLTFVSCGARADAHLLVWRGDAAMQLDAYASALRDALPPSQVVTTVDRDQLIGALNRSLEISPSNRAPNDVVLLAPTAALAFVEEERRALMLDVIPRALHARSRLHVVSVGPGRDPLFARQLAQLTGGALTAQTSAASARDSLRVMLDETRVAGARTPTGDVFLVPPESAAVTLLARMKAGAELRLVSPLEQIVDVRSFAPGLEWFQQGDTALITLTAPTPGRWRVSGDRVALGVYRDLELALVPDDGGLVARFEDAEGLVDESVLWELSRLRAWVQDESKAEPLAVESARTSTSPGRPHIVLPQSLAATERVVVALESRTFNLIAKHPPDAPQFLVATLIPLDQGVVVARMVLVDTTVVEAGARMFASIEAQSGRTKLVLATYARDRTWNAELPALDADVEVSFKVKGQSITGSAVEMQTAPIAWTQPLVASIVREFDAAGRPIGLVQDLRDETHPVAGTEGGGDAISTLSGESTDASPESPGREAFENGTDDASLATGDGARTLIIVAAIALGMIASGTLLFALIRRTRNRTSAAPNGLSSALDDYRQAMEARGA